MIDDAREARSAVVDVRVVDCDVHPYLRSPDELTEYMPEPWRSWPMKTTRNVYLSPTGGRRTDSRPPGGVSGSDPQFVDKQLLRDAGVDYAVLLQLLTGPVPNPEHSAALHHAVNGWLTDTWLGKDNGHGRYKGAITVPIDNVTAAVREIEEWAGHPHMIQVLVPDWALLPYGHPQYEPIWQAAARHHLPVAIHPGYSGGTNTLSTPLGHFRYQIEYKSLTYPQAMATHLTSLICAGMFDKVENLTFVFAEGGFSWLGPMLWRLDNMYDRLRVEVPAMKRRPLDYPAAHLRFASQPIEEPPEAQSLVSIFELLDAESILMFASDYPHYDFDDPKRALPRLPKSTTARIMHGNALDLYRLPARRPVGALDG